MLTPVLTSFQIAHPDVTVRFLTDMRVFRLDYGEAHVAIRAGQAPDEPDNVVQPLMVIRTGLYASKAYIAANGMPKGVADFGKHRFIGTDNGASRAPFHRWLREQVSEAQISFRASDPAPLEAAVCAGAGIGFLSAYIAATKPDLVEVMAPMAEWDAPLWIVTHVDLHRTIKVQAFLNHLKAAAQDWAKQCL